MAIDYQRRRVFVLDDEPAVADTLAEILNGSGYEAYARYTPQEILDLAAAVSPDLLITDVALGPQPVNGIEFAIHCERQLPGCRILLISGHPGTTDLHRKFHDAGYDFRLLNKPIHPEQLLTIVAETFRRHPQAA
jgi:DNA-binding NtrC family response regulator